MDEKEDTRGVWLRRYEFGLPMLTSHSILPYVSFPRILWVLSQLPFFFFEHIHFLIFYFTILIIQFLTLYRACKMLKHGLGRYMETVSKVVKSTHSGV